MSESKMSLGEAYAAQAAQKLREDSPPQRRLRKQHERAYIARFSFPNNVGGYDHAERARARHRRELLARSRAAITLDGEHFRNRLAVAFSMGPFLQFRHGSRKLRRDFDGHPRRDLKAGGTTEGPNGLPLLKYLPPASFGKKRFKGEVRCKTFGPKETVRVLGKRCRVSQVHLEINAESYEVRASMPADLSVNACKIRSGIGRIASEYSTSQSAAA